MKQIISLIFVIAIVVILSGCDRSQTNDEETVNKIPVEVSTLQLGNVVQSLYYSGDVKAEFEVKVFSKITDRIEAFYVDEGDKVSQGAPIARIYATAIEQAVRKAEAGFLAAKAQEANLRLEYERAKRLISENAMSQQNYDAIETKYEAVKAQLQQAEAALETAKSRLNDATITAPIDGIIGKRFYDTGDMAAPNLPVVTIVQMDRVKVTFAATEEDLGKLSVGQKAIVTVKSYPDRSFEGKVSKISPVLDPLTRMAEVEVIIDNSQKLLKPGMYSRVEVITGVISDVIVVPRYATIENTTLANNDQVVKTYHVFVVDSNKAVQKKLNVIYINHKSIAVDSGINIGDQLVITGQNNLRDGSAVAVIKEDGKL